ncbi:lipocalin family protein [Hymenobacter aerophilus]|uniref:lipocalin family protein n=1 Tax=Hymenobacter aerophilus TaxID=119644 RepID=UPI000362FA3D|nr:lipocalin family protein [Hymenobacter aerophilus]
MKVLTSSASRLLTGLFMFVLLFTAACGSKEGTVESVNMLYGTTSKTWKTDKETTAAGDKIKQTDAMDDQRVTFFANGQYNMSSGAQTMNGKYTFDQGAKTITMMPDGAGTSNTFTVVTLTDDKLTLKGTDGTELHLEDE